ncbi:hypothetical protein Ciccas_013500 [Cichlidogyrus casuarinus]|uniref:G-protein coupled receptors family 1 profile domain-containing protein n=1 Tax=Cichlidogyrus casuarinus TaxID=1844966 RepID=A0ABD2PLJ7_9PLAT
MGESSDSTLQVSHFGNIIWPIVFLIGWPGSLISSYIWAHRIKTTQNSTPVLQCFMSTLDSAFILLVCARNWIKGIAGVDLRLETGCALEPFLLATISQISSWVIIMLCFERLAFIFFPLRAKSICVPKIALINIVIISLLLCIANTPVFWLTNKVWNETESIHMCHFDSDNGMKVYVKDIYANVDFSMYSMIPLIAIIISHIPILNKLFISRRQVKAQSLSNQQRNGVRCCNCSLVTDNRTLKVVKTVLLMAFSHLVLTLPITLFYKFQDYISAGKAKDMIEFVFQVLQVLNHCLHFYIYSFTSTIFNESLMTLFPRVGPWLYRGQKTSSSNNLDLNNRIPSMLNQQLKKPSPDTRRGSNCSTTDSISEQKQLEKRRMLFEQRTQESRLNHIDESS